jgi:hypothetical protein
LRSMRLWQKSESRARWRLRTMFRCCPW